MRCMVCTLAVFGLAGCQNQAVPIRNPFLSPDRVPPPATRTILPGTAQPYYSGDPVPNTPSLGTPPPAFVPGGTSPVVPTNPPGGWNAQPPAGSTSPYNVNPTSAEFPTHSGPVAGESPIQVNADNQNLRFAQLPQQNPAAPSRSEYQSPVTPTTEPASQQFVVPTPYYEPLNNNQAPGQPTVFQSPVAPPQFENQSIDNQPVVPSAPREVTIRPVNSPISADSAQDGFRPQGSRLIKRDRPSGPNPNNNPTTPSGVAPLEFGPVREAAERFGFDPQYQWLRGQLQYLQATNQWQLRYIPVQGGADQFGGQMLIGNPQVLGELRPGDYVQVRGQLMTQQPSAGALLPIYMVSVVQRQQVQ